jgi:hypothetical protein
VRAAAVGLDPWRLIDLSAPEDLAIAEHLVSRLEANALAKVQAQANATAYRTVEGLIGLLEALGLVTRKR